MVELLNKLLGTKSLLLSTYIDAHLNQFFWQKVSGLCGGLCGHACSFFVAKFQQEAKNDFAVIADATISFATGMCVSSSMYWYESAPVNVSTPRNIYLVETHWITRSCDKLKYVG
jgi:hypothetical protein